MKKIKLAALSFLILSIVFMRPVYADSIDEDSTVDYTYEAMLALDNYYKSEERIFNDVISESEYCGFSLKWKHSENSLNDLLMQVENANGKALYQYNEENLRVAKNDNGNITTYTYVNGRIKTERSSNYEVIYFYDEEIPIGFFFNDKCFEYKYTNNYITEILCEGKVTCRYLYDENLNIHCAYSDIYEVDGKKVKLDDVNNIVYNGVYTDRETGWVYFGRYYDIKTGRYIDGISRENMQEYIKKYGKVTVEIISNIKDIDGDSSKYFLYENEKSSLLSGTSLSVEDKINIIARTIYFESSIDVFDQIGVASVVRNRMEKKGKTAYEIVSENGEFGGYEMAINSSYKVATGSSCWSQALANANRLYYGNPLVYSSYYYDDTYDFRALKGAATSDVPKFKLINNILYVRTQKTGSSTFEYIVKVKELYCPVQEKVNNDYYINKYVSYNELVTLEKRYGKMEKYNVFFKCS